MNVATVSPAVAEPYALIEKGRRRTEITSHVSASASVSRPR